MKQQLPSWRVDNVISMILSLIMVIFALGGVFFKMGILENKVDNLTQLLKEHDAHVITLTNSLNKVESHVCNLDSIHDLQCINGGN